MKTFNHIHSNPGQKGQLLGIGAKQGLIDFVTLQEAYILHDLQRWVTSFYIPGYQ